MTKSADAFLAGLDDAQREKALMEYDAPERLDWHFIPKPSRKGLQIREMTAEQRKSALALLQSSLSEIGYTKTQKIMALENLLKELEKNKTGTPLRDSERYYFTLFGKPSADGKWGLSIEGHHFSLNFVVDAGKVASTTPMVFCSNPAEVKEQVIPSIEKGLRVISAEETRAFDLLNALSSEQKKKVIFDEKPLAEVRDAGKPQPPQDAPIGIAYSELDTKQKKLLQSLVTAYLDNCPDDVAAERLKAIEASTWDKVFFAWAGADKPGTGHYYRVQGPSFVIEFVNTQPDAAGNPANHIHCMWRNMKGDFNLSAAAK